jgi:hypothetical protein
MISLPKSGLEASSVLKTIFGIVLVGLITSYVIFQARFLITGPQIILAGEIPTENNSRSITLEGTAFNITHLWLNDRQIFTDESGHFEEALILENGYTIATLRAKDRYGRETRVERSFVYTPASIMRN